MSQPIAPVIPYADPKTNGPFSSRAVVETFTGGVRVTVPGSGLGRFFLDFLGHFAALVIVLAAVVSGVANADSRGAAWGFVAEFLPLLAIIGWSAFELVHTAVGLTVIEIHRGFIKMVRPVGKPLSYRVLDASAFYSNPSGTSFGLRALAELRIRGPWWLPPVLLKRHDHPEVVWLANLLNEELRRQRAIARGEISG